MKLTAFLLIITFVQVKAEGFAQTITFSGKDVPLEKVFNAIKKQTGYGFFYYDEHLKNAKRVTLDVKNASVEEVLEICFKDQPYEYTIKDRTVFVVKKQIGGTSVNTEKGGKRINISGRVTGGQGEPVVGATVSVKGTEVATSTNDKGEFFLNDVKEEAVLVVTNVGYQMQELVLRGRNIVGIQLRVNVSDLDEAVVVAYNTTTQKRNTGSVTVVKGETIESLPNRSFDKSLQGMVPGLLVTPGTGQPGGGLSNFVLRGIATAASPTAGSTVRNPLIVIDGVPVTQESAQLYVDPNSTRPMINNPLAQLNPSDIESITVLKDAAAIALYGAKSSNGVILVTTKKGKAGKTRFNFRHQTDIAKAANNQNDLLTQDEYLDLLFETYKNTPRVIGGVTTPWTDGEILSDLRKKFPVIVASPGDTSFYPAADWNAALFNDAATTITNEISMSGGNERSLFYLNFEYTKQNGIVKKTGLDRKSARFNFEHRPTTWLKLGLNSTVSYTLQDYGGPLRQGGDASSSIALESSPLLPICLTNGEYVLNYKIGSLAGESVNPVAANDLTNKSNNAAFRGLSKFYGEIDFLRHFKFSTNVGFDFTLTEAKEKVDPRLYDPNFGYGGRIEQRSTRMSNLIANNILRYQKTFGSDHALGLLLGQEAQILVTKFNHIGVRNLSSPYFDEITSPGVTVFTQAGNTLKETLLSYFGQINYSFQNHYLVSGSIRRDGSSRFGEDKRFGTYWSTGFGWIISEEPFMKSTDKWLNFLKLRGSIGAAGNAGAIDRFTPFTRLELSGYLGAPAVIPFSSLMGNPDAKWENTFSWDAGIELRLFRERISVTADIYERQTSDVIYMMFVPLSSGYSAMIGNIGEMRNKGVELSISADIFQTKDFRWNISANWSTNKNRFTKINGEEIFTANFVANKVGQPLDAFYLVRWAGVNSADGSPMWIDSTGKPGSNYNAAKPEFVGKSQPDGFGAVTNTFSYRGLELHTQFIYQYRFQIYNSGAYLVRDGFNPYANEGKAALDRWQKPGDIAANPKRVLNNKNPGGYHSTRYLRDGDFVRFQNARIAYNLPNSLLSRVHLNSVKVYVQGNNLALWTKQTDRDPGTVGSRGFVEYIYPNPRTYSLGLIVNF